MESSTYILAQEINSKIDRNEARVRHIDILLKSCGISCAISGTQHNQFRKTADYVTTNKEFIKKLLEADRIQIESELKVLKQQFSEL